jgi:hypothetical protein
VIVEPPMYDECRASRQVEGPYLHTFGPQEGERYAAGRPGGPNSVGRRRGRGRVGHGACFGV